MNQLFLHIDADQLTQWRRHARNHYSALCQPRPEESNKGSFGTLGIIGGAPGMSGSIMLAGSAALKSGCGKVWLGFHQDGLPLPVLSEQPEIMLATDAQLRQRTDVTTWVIGCGLGTSDGAQARLREVLGNTTVPLLLDADALNLVAKQDDLLPDSSSSCSTSLVMTPHPAEAARLLHNHTADVQANRHRAVLQLAKRYGAWVVLKGHHSLIASPDGQVEQNPSGNAGLATAGSGDVLSGIIGSLLAQHIPTHQAVAGGVWLHGLAAEILATNGIGPIGLCAGEIVDAVRWLRNMLTDT
ncbi:NAD(P)H-hydrate dehydratase [Snodgrassella sp. CFCC 13594]|uniref:NAD(P)H-hydrate dehydratase n=1 Tax=Snodgrassella sp. CFCC 13594 TaxID=1775559 RepID=UPI000A446329|nr:NAD(P)H-hydrate dehydratase [Snodgrassella sp. CFCC 13594]